MFDLSRASANATLQCPVSPGAYEVTQTVELPKEIPRGLWISDLPQWRKHRLLTFRSIAKFAVQIRGVTAEDKDMLCLNLFIGSFLCVFFHMSPYTNPGPSQTSCTASHRRIDRVL